MKIHAVLTALALWLAPSLSFAQAGTADATCTQILANRNSINAPVVHLYGDSIMRGAALGKFEDGDDPLDPADPLYAFRSPASMANWALSHNGRAERVAYCGPISATTIQSRIASGIIRAGDTVVLEDAGAYEAGPNAYYSFWWSVRQAASASGVTLVMMSMFDYCTGQNMACSMQYDIAVGTQGTLNDATRRAALVTANPVNASGSALNATLRFIDMNWIMDAWRNSALSVDGVDVMRGDGVHPNVWGQMKMVQHMLAAAGLRAAVTNTTPLEDLAAANYQTLAYGSQTFTAARARSYVAAMLDGG